MRTAIIGLPRTGKSSLFSVLTGTPQHERLGTLEARVGVVKVPDERVEALAEVFRPRRVTHATLEFVDFPAISREALSEPAYLAAMRVVDGLAHVVRVFESETVAHEKGSVDPRRDIEQVETELILSDLVVVEKRLERVEKDLKKMKSVELELERALLGRVKEALESGKPLRELRLGGEAEKRLRGFQFLSQKPMLYVLNIGESDAPRLHEIEEEYRNNLVAGRCGTQVVGFCGKVEAELAELELEERGEFSTSFGLKESALERVVRATYRLLGLRSFITANENEVRAWTMTEGTTALKAAGIVHTDFEKKFIRAEVASWQDLVACGGYAGAREKGLLRLEGKDYVVKDGDVLLIRHG